MAAESSFVSNLNCRNVVVVRWDTDATNGVVPSSIAVIQFIRHVGYRIGDIVSLKLILIVFWEFQERIRCTPCPADPEQFIILPMATEEEAKRICHDSDTKGFGINNVSKIFKPNKIRIS